MKSLIMISMLMMGAGMNSWAAADQPITKEVTIAINDVFVPEVAYSNADAKVILTGMFANSCYRWSRAEVQSGDMLQQVKALGLVTTNSMCLMVLVPYSKEVNLGKLAPGEHTLRFISGDDTFFERKLVVQ